MLIKIIIDKKNYKFHNAKDVKDERIDYLNTSSARVDTLESMKSARTEKKLNKFELKLGGNSLKI